MNSMSGQKLKGIPYTGTLPAVLTGTKAGYLHSYKIYGNLSQNGTPTPENPIVPSECGERTENLFDESNFVLIQVTATAYRYGTSLGVLPQGTYIFNATKLSGAQSIYLTAKLNDIYSQTTISSVPFSFTADGNSEYIIRTANNTGTTWEAEKYSNMMLNLGSTALPYIPYGYKLPLLSGSTPVDIYLSESQTTRRIKKLVLTGEESWSLYEEGNVWQFYTNNIISGLTSSSCMSNIAEYGATATTRGRYSYGAYLVSSGRGIAFQMIGSKDAFVDVASWKAYLAQQYSNGTPVTIWYVLATPQTTTLNEPLRKIGDYADTIDSTQTTAQIPTTANSTTISWAGQGLAPSEFDSIQEWVDIPTYKRVNGEWVEDNSN